MKCSLGYRGSRNLISASSAANLGARISFHWCIFMRRFLSLTFFGYSGVLLSLFVVVLVPCPAFAQHLCAIQVLHLRRISKCCENFGFDHYRVTSDAYARNEARPPITKITGSFTFWYDPLTHS